MTRRGRFYRRYQENKQILHFVPRWKERGRQNDIWGNKKGARSGCRACLPATAGKRQAGTSSGLREENGGGPFTAFRVNKPLPPPEPAYGRQRGQAGKGKSRSLPEAGKLRLRFLRIPQDKQDKQDEQDDKTQAGMSAPPARDEPLPYPNKKAAQYCRVGA